ncbi:hypothetical protein SAMD00019534_122930, partial [Acytostelium subglobosum LB1]|uniref:hypothetical protein n=1 Tax=Acytostelium subglobosum LB1 TaxID=1410327 RepID=UPI000644E362
SIATTMSQQQEQIRILQLQLQLQMHQRQHMQVLSILAGRTYIDVRDLLAYFSACKAWHHMASRHAITQQLYQQYVALHLLLLKKMRVVHWSHQFNPLPAVHALPPLVKLRTDLTMLNDLIALVHLLDHRSHLNVILENNSLFHSIVQGHYKDMAFIDKLLCYAILYSNEVLLLFIVRLITSLQQVSFGSMFRSIEGVPGAVPVGSTPSGASSSSSLRLSSGPNQHQQQQQQQYTPSPNEQELALFNITSCRHHILLTPLALFIASAYPQGGSSVLKQLLSLGQALYSVTMKLVVSQRTPLFLAASREITLTLLQNKAKNNEKDSSGMLPIHYHSLVGNLEVIKCLLDDTTVNAQDLAQNTPLHWSSLKGHLLVVKTLISSGARLNIANAKGRYPVHNAAMEGHIDIIKYFIDLYTKASQKGTIRSSNGSASIQIADKENNTPIDLAILKNHFYVTFELLKYEGVLLQSDEFDFMNGRKIGSGAFADVYLMQWRGRQVAVKRVKYDRLLESGKSDEWIKGKFLLEVVLMVKLSHLSSFVKLFGTVIEQKELLLILEFCSHGSLYNILNTIGNDDVIATLPSINILSLSIANGMAYLHGLSPQIIHRDLTSQNILLDATGSSKIADFGISRFKNDIGDKTMTSIGNPRWRAPEVTKGEKYSEKVDVFGFGMILYEMFSRRMPFHELEPVQASFKVASGERPRIPPNVDSRWAKLIQQCWDHSAANRPSFTEVIQIIQQLPISNIKPFSDIPIQVNETPVTSSVDVT